ncbi:hypothetical protein GCM10007049_24100 [Echinicola pacifica]|uniref:Chitobiase/beta-hexosaminidase C-terminal domain-containing protein n=2 Tax=Echinicola pacifica TaxID=346377 RepID=A0A918URP7_9BACT|nr:hypothetical protein GCM10007049_24100 [Echinicola pacifica]
MNNMNKWISGLENLLIVFAGLLLIFIIGGQGLVVPAVLQVLGRSHPLLLHFPIVLLLLAIIFVLIPGILPENNQKQFTRIFLLIAAFFAGITVLSGWMLSMEEGYEGNDLEIHKWLGVAVFVATLLLYFLRNISGYSPKIIASALAITLLAAGHWGANLTHGSDFLMEPLNAGQQDQVPLEEALVFDHVVKPILDKKCVNCHQASKSKGDLRLDEINFIQAGGKSGALFDSAAWQQSLLVERLDLPMDEKKHMPPKGKVQLTQDELAILKLWVEDGAPVEGKLATMEAESPWHTLAASLFTETTTYDFEPADEELIESLNNYYRRVRPLYPGSPALEVNYYGTAAFAPASLAELNKVRHQVVSVNMARMPLAEVGLDWLDGFDKIEELNLNFTGVSVEQLAAIAKLPNLQRLMLAGNTLSAEIIPTLETMGQLDFVSLWQTGLDAGDFEESKLKSNQVVIEWGFLGGGETYQLNAPQVKYDHVLFDKTEKVTLKHPIGTVKIKYTLDGNAPDSLNGNWYTEPITVDQTCELQAVAYADGWEASLPQTVSFYRKSDETVRMNLNTSPSGNYQGKGTETLMDGEKGDVNYASGAWLGFKDQPLDLEITPSGEELSLLAISMMYHEEAHIFPPKRITIQGQKAGSSQWTDLAQETFDVPSSSQPNRLVQLRYELPKGRYEKLRLKVFPVTNVPAWHRGAGDKAWVFVDEVLVN